MNMDGQLRFRWSFAVVAAVGLVSFQACKTEGAGSDKPAATSTAVGEAPPSKPSEPSPVNTGFGLPLAANKCPSAAPGSTTTWKEIPDGVEVTVTAPGGLPINDIRQRGTQIVAAAKEPGAGGSAADGLAKCPIVVKDTIVTEVDVPGGATFTIKPSKPTALADLKKETKSRADGYKPELAK
jgi:hypothetical protein